MFARLFFSSSRQVGFFKIPWIYRKVGRQVGLENFYYFGQVSLKIIENMNFLVGRQVGFSQKVHQKKQVGRQVSQVASKHWVTYPLEKLESRRLSVFESSESLPQKTDPSSIFPISQKIEQRSCQRELSSFVFLKTKQEKSQSEGAPLFRPKKKVRESTQKVEIRSPCIEWVTVVVYMCSEVPGS